MTTNGDTTGSPERRAWAAAEAPAGRPTKRGPDRMAVQDGIGGATAPLPVGAMGTPPAQRRRMPDFTSTAIDTAGQVKELAALVKVEFERVWDALQKTDDKTFDLIDQDTLDKMQLSYDRRFKDLGIDVSKVHSKLQELDDGHEKTLKNLNTLEKELMTWTAASDAT